MTEIDWPAWIQAIGSVAAIVVAIAVAAWQSHRSREERRQDHRDLLATVAATAERSQQAALRTLNLIAGDENWIRYEGIGTSQVEDAKRILESVTLQDIRRPAAFLAVCDLLKDLDGVIRLAEGTERDVESDGRVDPETLDYLPTLRDRVEKNVSTICREAKWQRSTDASTRSFSLP